MFPIAWSSALLDVYPCLSLSQLTGEGFQNDGCFDWNLVKGRSDPANEHRQAGGACSDELVTFCDVAGFKDA